MTAQSIEIFTLDIPNPEWTGLGGSTHMERVNTSLGYNYLFSYDIVTVSDSGANNANDVTGLLYTPDLDPTDQCVSLSAPWVPSNATRQSNLPNKDFNLVGIAPWISAECTLNWFAAAQEDPIRGFIFFLPEHNGTEAPPDASDPIYSLGDSEKWKLKNDWPVYIITTEAGMRLMNASAAYSGNMTAVPYGHQLSEYYDPRDYVRLYVDIDTGSRGEVVPTIWVFLLVVLGILAGVIALTTVSLHWLNRRRREALRQRVASGEVDLEALGIKRLVVPQHILNNMPLYIFGVGRRVSDSELKESPTNSGEKEGEDSPPESPRSVVQPRPALLHSLTLRTNMLQQPTCAICLDDFVRGTGSNDGTIVRELPCRHIFHPECVDTFLRDSSSLCPICKKTTLPIGYCPKNITNAMVRRERIVRRIRERVSIDSEDADDEAFIEEMYRDHPSNPSHQLCDRTASSLSQFTMSRQLNTTPVAVSGQPSEPLHTLEESFQRPASYTFSPGGTGGDGSRDGSAAAFGEETGVDAMPIRAHSSLPSVQPPPTLGRRAWARRRAEAMLGRRPLPDPDDEADSPPTTSIWQRAVRDIFHL